MLLFPWLLSERELHRRLVLLAKEGDAKKLARLLKDSRVDVNYHEPRNGGTALYYAAQRGHTECVRVLLQSRHVDVNSEIAPKDRLTMTFVDDYRFPSRIYVTPLHIACARGYVEVVQELLKHPGINVNLDSNAMTPLHAAIRNGQRPVIDVLLVNAKGLDVNRAASGSSPLHYACELGSESAAEVLLGHPLVSVYLKNKAGQNVLQVALNRGEVNIARAIKDREMARMRKAPPSLWVA